jgi:hypothetical protein
MPLKCCQSYEIAYWSFQKNLPDTGETGEHILQPCAYLRKKQIPDTKNNSSKQQRTQCHCHMSNHNYRTHNHSNLISYYNILVTIKYRAIYELPCMHSPQKLPRIMSLLTTGTWNDKRWSSAGTTTLWLPTVKAMWCTHKPIISAPMPPVVWLEASQSSGEHVSGWQRVRFMHQDTDWKAELSQ